MVTSAMIAAIYVVVTVLQNLLLPGSTSAAIQFRISEALCILTMYSPSAIAGLTLGCIISNIFAGLGAIDLIVGPLATLLAGITMRALKDKKIFKLPVWSLLMPAIFNGLLVGAEIALFFSGGGASLATFLTNFALIAAGEAAVLYTLGVAIYLVIEKNRSLKEKIV